MQTIRIIYGWNFKIGCDMKSTITLAFESRRRDEVIS